MESLVMLKYRIIIHVLEIFFDYRNTDI
uniref:Uncharacterized protein n=1 Tax=Rhizophora mucronata TaxID=61149 RepID=A0A2P2QHW2_RHIMU